MVARAEGTGQYVKGQSGNPAGRPPNSRGTLKSLQREMEIAIRQHLGVDRMKRIVNKVAEMAEGGSIPAAKLIFDKIIANASDIEDAGESGRTVVFRIENATFAALQAQQSLPKLPAPVIDVAVVEIKPTVQESNVQS